MHWSARRWELTNCYNDVTSAGDFFIGYLSSFSHVACRMEDRTVPITERPNELTGDVDISTPAGESVRAWD